MKSIKLYGPVYERKAFIEFFDAITASTVYSHYNDKKGIRVSWGIDKSKNKGWAAVVVRNLPPGCTISTIMRNFTKNGEKVKSIMEIKKIKGQYCTVVITESLKDAEEICLKHNGEKLNPLNKLKVNLHPHNCLLRQSDSLPHNEFFTNINQNIEMIKESVKKNKERVTKLPTELKQSLISYFDEYNKEHVLNTSQRTKVETKSPDKDKGKDSFNQDTKSSHVQDINSPYQPKKYYTHNNDSEDIKEYRPERYDNTPRNGIEWKMKGLEEKEILVDEKHYACDKAKSHKKERHDYSRKHYYDDYHRDKRYYKSDSRERSRYNERRARDYYPSNYEKDYSRYNIITTRRDSKHRYSRRDRSRESYND